MSSLVLLIQAMLIVIISTLYIIAFLQYVSLQDFSLFQTDFTLPGHVVVDINKLATQFHRFSQKL